MVAEHDDGPAAPEPGPSDSAQGFIESVEPRLQFDRHVVLVVDDEPSLRNLVCEEIKRAAPAVLTVQAGDGEEALAKIADVRASFKTEPLFIVTDLKMPRMDGWNLLRRLRDEYEAAGRTQGIPVIVLSSTAGERRTLFARESVHGDKAAYIPLVSVAKENCTAPLKYDAVGRAGLIAWIKHFLQGR